MMSDLNETKCPSCFAPLNLLSAQHGIVTCEFCGTQVNYGQKLALLVSRHEHSFAIVLAEKLAAHCNILELKTITVVMSGKYDRLDWEDLPGSGKTMKAMELVLFARRHSQLALLVETVEVHRPDILLEIIYAQEASGA